MILRVRYLFRLLKALFTRFKGIIFLGTIIGILIFFFISVFIPYILKDSNKNIGLVGMFKTDEMPDLVNNMITEGLTKVNSAGELEPGIASLWESPDQGKTWAFHINENIKWQDGKSIESDDINYNFTDVAIEKPDKNTVIFKLKDKFSPFPYVVSKPLYKRGLMGMGEWKVEKIELIKDFVETLKMKNSLGDRINIRFYPTEEKAKLSFKLGKVDTLEDIYNVSPFDTWKTTNITKKTNYGQVITLFFNNKNSNLEDKTLRQALNYAIDKNAASLERAISPISPISWAYNSQVKNYNYDLAKAKEISSSINNIKNNEVQLNLYVTPTLLSIAEKISKDWLALNIKTNIIVSSIIPSEFDAFLAILDIPKDPDQYSLWHSTQSSTNISSYQNQRIDKLLEDGRIELNLEERKKIYLDFQRFLVEDCPAVFLYHPSVYKIERK